MFIWGVCVCGRFGACEKSRYFAQPDNVDLHHGFIGAFFLHLQLGTCSGGHAPRGEAIWCGEAVEHADILRRQELHELGIVENFPLTVEYGGCLVGDVNDLPSDEGHRYCKYILKVETEPLGFFSF